MLTLYFKIPLPKSGSLIVNLKSDGPTSWDLGDAKMLNFSEFKLENLTFSLKDEAFHA